MNQPYKILLCSNGECKCWFEPEPEYPMKTDDYLSESGTESYEQLVHDHKADIYHWQSCFTIIPCAEGEAERILQVATKVLPEPLRLHDYLEAGFDITPFAEVREEKRCSNSCDWPRCTFKDCMEKHPDEWVKGKQLFVFFRDPESVEKETHDEEMLLNMQYYMEYCQINGYVTPKDWLTKYKHF